MLQVIVFIVALFLDLYIAGKYSEKYNITQNPIVKYKYLNQNHKNYSKLIGVITALSFVFIPARFSDNINGFIEITIYLASIGYLAFALLDTYYRKNTDSYKPSLKRIGYTYSFCIISFVVLSLIS